ncbi:MAG: hypothetical protein LBH71_03540, partial [Oscillospiraceae bacterium]|nr:hypothetical protein [Oscillospiraceae bacterium]
LDQIALLCVIPAITSLLSIFFVLVDYFNMIRDNSQVRVKRGAAIHKPRTKTSKPKEAERIEKSTQILHNDVEEDMSSYLEDI